MGSIIWIVIALAIVSIAIYVAAVRNRQKEPQIELPPGETLPKTHLQRYAGWTLLEVAFLTLLAAAIVAFHGPEVWWEHDRVRLTVTLILLVALATYLVFFLAIRRLKDRDDGSFDERDSVIMNRSGEVVGGVMMVVMAAWMIALTEAHQDTHLVPTYFLYLIFWSLVMTNVIASLAGIFLAYRRS